MAPRVKSVNKDMPMVHNGQTQSNSNQKWSDCLYGDFIHYFPILIKNPRRLLDNPGVLPSPGIKEPISGDNIRKSRNHSSYRFAIRPSYNPGILPSQMGVASPPLWYLICSLWVSNTFNLMSMLLRVSLSSWWTIILSLSSK